MTDSCLCSQMLETVKMGCCTTHPITIKHGTFSNKRLERKKDSFVVENKHFANFLGMLSQLHKKVLQSK